MLALQGAFALHQRMLEALDVETIQVRTPAELDRADALVMQLGAEAVFVGSGIFKSEEPAKMANAVVEATTNFRDPHILAKVSRGLGKAMNGQEIDKLDVKLAERGW